MREDQREKWQRYFREFLGTCNIVNMYCMACAEQGRSMRDTLNKHKPENWISCAFILHQTREGYEFWQQIDDEWQKYVEAIRKESQL
jgi:hypothetical protein